MNADGTGHCIRFTPVPWGGILAQGRRRDLTEAKKYGDVTDTPMLLSFIFLHLLAVGC